MLRTALRLAERALAVFPCLAGSKRPATPRGFRDATTDRDIIGRWWSDDPNYNIGLATGDRSGVFAVDVDGLDAEAELRRLEAAHGALPATVEVITPRPGRHLYFRMPDGRALSCSQGKLAPGIDIKASGGYTILPPSVHPTGRRYAWSVDTASAFAAAPDWLIEKIAAPVCDTPRPIPSSEWHHLVGEIAEGRRDCTLARVAGHLLRRYCDPRLVLELMHALNSRCVPPLPAEDVVRIVDSIAGREIKRRTNGGR